MEKFFKTAIIVGILSLSISSLWFVYEYKQLKTEPGLKSFSVSAEGEEIAIPDIAEISIGVITEGNDLKILQKENTEKINKIINFLKEKGIEEKDIKTENYIVSPQYDYKISPYKIISYSISQTLSIKVRDFSKIGDILSQSVNYGANNVYGPNFKIDNQDVYLEKAREKAIKKAKEKAQQIAKDAGFKLGKILNVSEPSSSWNPIRAKAYSAPEQVEAVPSPQIQPGSQEVKSQITITFEIK